MKSNRLASVVNQEPTCLLSETRHSWLEYLGLPDGQLDCLLYRGLQELSSELVPALSDHLGIQAVFSFLDKKTTASGRIL